MRGNVPAVAAFLFCPFEEGIDCRTFPAAKSIQVARKVHNSLQMIDVLKLPSIFTCRKQLVGPCHTWQENAGWQVHSFLACDPNVISPCNLTS